MRLKSKPTFDAKALLPAVAQARTSRDYRKSRPIFVQGDRADAVFSEVFTSPRRRGEQFCSDPPWPKAYTSGEFAGG